MSSKAQEFQNLIAAYVGKLYIESLTGDREVLEDEAMKTACACQRSGLSDKLHEMPDEDLLAIVTRARPCQICSE